MALRNLVIEGDPLLRKTSRPVDEITPRIIKLLDDLADTMYYENRGIGIAAPQVGVLRRVFIVDIGDDHGKIEFINPEILEKDGSQVGSEGCLSVPGKSGWVKRPMYVKATALDENMESFEIEGTELFARAMCHEFDHLKGELYVRLAEGGLVDNEELMAAEEEEE